MILYSELSLKTVSVKKSSTSNGIHGPVYTIWCRTFFDWYRLLLSLHSIIDVSDYPFSYIFVWGWKVRGWNIPQPTTLWQYQPYGWKIHCWKVHGWSVHIGLKSPALKLGGWKVWSWNVLIPIKSLDCFNFIYISTSHFVVFSSIFTIHGKVWIPR